jgi:hypothetical protein
MRPALFKARRSLDLLLNPKGEPSITSETSTKFYPIGPEDVTMNSILLSINGAGVWGNYNSKRRDGKRRLNLINLTVAN